MNKRINERKVKSILSSNQSKPRLILINLSSRSYRLIVSRARVLTFTATSPLLNVSLAMRWQSRSVISAIGDGNHQHHHQI